MIITVLNNQINFSLWLDHGLQIDIIKRASHNTTIIHNEVLRIMKEWQFTYKSVIFGWETFYTSMVKGVLQLGFKDLDKVKAMTSRL